jgi:hypothetical protein
MRYQILIAATHSALVAQVNKAMQRGWLPQGGHVCAVIDLSQVTAPRSTPKYTLQWSQGMVK